MEKKERKQIEKRTVLKCYREEWDNGVSMEFFNFIEMLEPIQTRCKFNNKAGYEFVMRITEEEYIELISFINQAKLTSALEEFSSLEKCRNVSFFNDAVAVTQTTEKSVEGVIEKSIISNLLKEAKEQGLTEEALTNLFTKLMRLV